MKIFLIRHGETTGDVENRYGGEYNDHLSEKGKKQAKELAEKLKGKGIQIIFYSPKLRTAETAEIVNHVLNITSQTIDAFRERNNYGIFTGLIKSEAKQKYPQEVEKLERDKIYHDIKNSEDYYSFKTRVISAFEKIINQEYERIAIITHGGPISCIIREILKFGEFKYLGDCAIIEIEKGDKLILLKMENAEFLKA